jgi:hypothetical protein
MSDYYERDLHKSSDKASDRKERVKEAKNIEPKGKPSDQY